jgi:hypothetical protein
MFRKSRRADDDGVRINRWGDPWKLARAGDQRTNRNEGHGVTRLMRVGVLGAMGATVTLALMSPTATLALMSPVVSQASLANTAGPPTTTHLVQPTYNAGNITTCPKGTTTFINTSDLGPGNQDDTYSSGGTVFMVMVDTGTYITFSTNSPSFTVYVKGGPAWDTYDYTGTPGHPNYPSDTGLHAPYNNGSRIPTISHYLVCGQPAVSKVQPSFGTTPSAGGSVGVVVLNDTATLSGGASPTGMIEFDLWPPSESSCSGTAAYTQMVTVSGNGSYSTTNSTMANAAGTWRWTAAYSGDSANFGASSACGTETVSVAKATTALSTTPSAGGTVNSVVLNDQGTLSGGYGTPGGSITFDLWDPTETTCTGTPAYTQTVTVSGDGSYSTTNTTKAGTSGTWSWTATYSGDSNNNGASSTCGIETVTVSTTVPPGSCEGSGALSTFVSSSGGNVISYIPKGNWISSTTGIDVVNVEGSSITNTLIPTGTDVINSCASNSVTGQTVCTANNNDVYVLKGTGLDPSVSPNPLTDGGSGAISFSGGSATTTGVSMDATDNKALLALSVGSVGGFQLLDLATDTFEPAFTTMDPAGAISEDPLIDPIRHLILSASEDNNYELVDVSTSTSPKFFEHPVSNGNYLDSSSEDCSTGIILAPAELSSPTQVEIADISNPGTAPEAVFTPGSPGSWTAPEQVQTLTGSSFVPGGSSVAQGTHTGVISGEFGGDGLTALALPTTSGAGAVPTIGNWVTCATGADPSGNPFSMGFDPHTLAAYQSPNGGDAIALLVNGDATEMVRVDLTSVLSLASTGNVCNSSTIPSGDESFIALP